MSLSFLTKNQAKKFAIELYISCLKLIMKTASQILLCQKGLCTL